MRTNKKNGTNLIGIYLELKYTQKL